MKTAGFVLISDTRVRAVPLIDNGEPLVSLREAGPRVRVDESRSFVSDGSPHFHLAREGVCMRLQQAAATLPPGLRLVVLEAYRPLAHQAALFERYRRGFAAHNPNADPAMLERMTARFVAPVDVAGHPTGAAVDVTLCDLSGRLLDMGSDPNSAVAASALEAPGLGVGASARRMLLSGALREQGFVNYPSEWWHWSWGDRYWAFVQGAAAAVYGALSEPDVPPGEPALPPDGPIQPPEPLTRSLR
jgi:zinc D-Ala-D-Ala dipeptidase